MGQFKALMVKNWIMFIRSPVGSAFEILLPIIVALFILLVRNLATIQNYSEQSFLNNQTLTLRHYGDPVLAGSLGVTLPTLLKLCPSDRIIALAPPGDPLVSQLKTLIQGSLPNPVIIFSSDQQIDSKIRDQNYGVTISPICFAVSFKNQGHNYKYNLRFNVSNNVDRSEAPSTTLDLTTENAMNMQMYSKVLRSGFIGLTNIINNMILQAETGLNSDVFINKLGPIYQQEYVRDPIYTYLGTSSEFILLFPLLIIFLRQTGFMLDEKEKKIRESMSITGMKTWIYYLTWFVRYYAVYVIVHAINSAIISGTFKQIPYYIPLVVFLLFDIVLVVQSFFIQIFFTRSKIGIIFALLFFIIQYVLYYTVANNQDPSPSVYRAVSIIPHVAFILAFKEMIYVESIKGALTFTSVFNSYTIVTAIISFVLNILFYGILTWYLDQVFPNQWGAKKHPLFCCFSNRENSKENSSIQQETKLGSGNIEKNSQIQSVENKFKQMSQAQRTIQIKNLHKTYSGDVHAVKDLSMTMYTDQIFVLLGHNGAGKTTTISMLTGMIEATSGSIEILGSSKLEDIRSKIGVCPQHDTLYDDLTVEEHLRLFSTFRGFEGDELQEQIVKLIKDVNLEQKHDEYSKNLSGGQKRRLSVAMAFTGGAKVIILDEPTSGMDTSARRYIWEMLKNYKSDRIILLTTHFMDEADYLGDRIAIMAGGKLAALGSNVFLKNKFGVGYNITFVKKGIQVPSDPIYNCVHRHAKSATILSNVSSQVAIQLPMEEIDNFPKMFAQIDSKKNELGIQTYGISITTLQEVFLKVGEEAEEAQEKQEFEKKPQKSFMDSNMASPNKTSMIELNPQGSKVQQSEQLPPIDDDEINEQENWVRQDGTFQRFFSHFLATILKRLRVIKRDFKSFIFQLILPMIIIVAALLLMKISFIKDFPEQALTFNTYVEQNGPNIIPISATSANSAFLDTLELRIKQVYGPKIQVRKYIHPTDSDFDSTDLLNLKKQYKTLKGGIFFNPRATSAVPSIDTIQFTSIVNTRSPTSVITIQSLAAQAYINHYKAGSDKVTITPVNKPMPKTFRQLQLNNTISGFFGAVIFSIALSFKFASIVAFIVKQRQDKSKHQQIVSGMNIASYWFGNYIYDFALYIILAIFSVIMIKALKIQSLIQGNAFAATCLLFFLYGFANVPLTYIFGYLFKDYGNAQGAVYFFNFIVGGVVTIIVMVLRWIDGTANQVGRGIAWPLRIIPCFSFGEGLTNIGSLTLISFLQNNGKPLDSFSPEIALSQILYLACFGCFFIAMLFVLEYLQNNENFMRCFTKESQYNEIKSITDQDVINEQKKAMAANPNDYEILTKQLRKVYILDSQKKHKVAVDSISFGVNKGEVFGLLGVNGAGKSTTFKMLSGEIVSTSGESYFTGMKISENLNKIRKNLGYCPQFDALIENLTVQEQLELFYDLKCLPKIHKQKSINRKIIQMNLEKYTDKMSGTLSGGNKRKLSVAMAMIGNPHIIFLDEPSTGMDPKARRFMWKVISRISTERKQSTVILTTHSMEEAQALSTRLGIMVNGNFKCIGTPQHIKSKFGKGFELEVKIKNIKKDQIDKIRHENKIDQIQIEKSELLLLLQTLKVPQQTVKAISDHGSGSYIWKQLDKGKKCSVSTIIEFCLVEQKVQKITAILKQTIGEVDIIEHLQTFVRFKTGNEVNVGKIFQFFESKKVELSIMQYSIRQATVQQIFNKFAQQDGGNMQMD